MAKNKLAGITLEIGGDTTELSKALQQPNKEASDLQSKLKAVDQALKLDPTNTDLLAQKQRLLSESIATTESKLKLLKQAQDEFIKSGKSIDSAEYIELEKQIAQTEKKLKDLKTASDEVVKSNNKISTSLKSAGSAFESASQKTKGLSTAAGGLLAAWTATIPATDELRQDLSYLEQNAIDAGIGAQTAETAFDTFNNVINETDSSVEGVSNLLQAGFTESNLQKAVEGLTGAYIKFPDTLKIESLADSLQETLATGTATGQFGELLDRLGIGADNFSTELAKCSTEAEKQELVLKTLSDNGLNATYESYVKNNSAMIESRDATQQFQEAMANLSEAIMPIITAITNGITGLVNWFTQLDPTIQQVTIIVLALVAALSPVTGILASIATASAALNISLLAIIATIVGIIAAVTAVILIFQNWDSICQWFSEQWSVFTTWLGDKFESFKNFFINTGKGVLNWFKELPSNIMNFVASIPNQMLNFGKNILNSLISGIKSLFGSLGNVAKQIGTTIINAIKNLPSQMIEIGKNLLSGLWEGIKSGIGGLWDNVKSWGSDFIGGIAGIFGIHSPSTVFKNYIGKNLMEGLKQGIVDYEYMALNPLEDLANKMSNFNLSSDISGAVTQALNTTSSVTVTSPIQIDLDGKPIYQNVVTRITRTQGMRSQFKGGYG